MSSAQAGTSVREARDGTFRLAAIDGHFAAVGPLTFATARHARELAAQLLEGARSAVLEVDCAGITACDSAGLAVLLDWLGTVKRAGHTLHYSHLPAGLMALARISEVEELLAPRS